MPGLQMESTYQATNFVSPRHCPHPAPQPPVILTSEEPLWREAPLQGGGLQVTSALVPTWRAWLSRGHLGLDREGGGSQSGPL
jgi:hypothetical protein